MPPKGTAGLARSRVSGSSRDPLPPARTTANTSFIFRLLRGEPTTRERMILGDLGEKRNHEIQARCSGGEASSLPEAKVEFAAGGLTSPIKSTGAGRKNFVHFSPGLNRISTNRDYNLHQRAIARRGRALANP